MNLTLKTRALHDEPPTLRPDWQRMSSYVHQVVQAHPGMEPLRQAKKRFHVYSSPAWIGIAAVPSIGSGAFEIEVQTTEEEWWVPATRSHGDAIADELVRRVMERWAEVLAE